MQQRRVRLGDVLDDYCPRERRVTNHAVVAMVGDEVKQTRCSTCDAEHEYKGAKVPAPRRRKSGGALSADTAEGLIRPKPAAAPPEDDVSSEEVLEVPHDEPAEVIPLDADPPLAARTAEGSDRGENQPINEEDEREGAQDDWGHRPLIRATLPRQEGQTPERKAPDFTLRGGRFDGARNGQRNRGARPGRQPTRQGQPHGSTRFGSGHGPGHNRPPGGGPARHGSGPGQRQGSGQGNRSGSTQPPRGGRPSGHGRGPGGRKRGR